MIRRKFSPGNLLSSPGNGGLSKTNGRLFPPIIILCIALLVFFSFARTTKNNNNNATLLNMDSSEMVVTSTMTIQKEQGFESSSSSSSSGNKQRQADKAREDEISQDEAIEEANEELQIEKTNPGADLPKSDSSSSAATTMSSEAEPTVLAADLVEEETETEEEEEKSNGNNVEQEQLNINKNELPLEKSSDAANEEGEEGEEEKEDDGGSSNFVSESNLVISGLGDVLLLNSLAGESLRMNNFRHLWKPVEKYWRHHSHFTFANFEGTTGAVNTKGVLVPDARRDDKTVYTTGIQHGGFNYHQSLVTELVESGVNVLTTANNHAFDRGMQGIQTTAQLIERAGAVQVGSLRVTAGELKTPYYEGWYRITEKNGWRVAWVGCTTILCSECRASLRAPKSQVERRILFCENAPLLVYRLSKRRDIDLVVVGAHWGPQFVDRFAPRTVEIAHQLLDAGAAVIYGNHPHVMQGAEYYRTKDGRNTYVAYSIGSITSGLGSSPAMWKRRTSVILFVEFKKFEKSKRFKRKRRTGEVVSVRYLPICEVKATNGTARFHTMMATAKTKGKCDTEEAWAKYLLGARDFRTPDQLPRVRAGGFVLVKDRFWKQTRAQTKVEGEEDAEEVREIEARMDQWKREGQ